MRDHSDSTPRTAIKRDNDGLLTHNLVAAHMRRLRNRRVSLPKEIVLVDWLGIFHWLLCTRGANQNLRVERFCLLVLVLRVTARTNYLHRDHRASQR